MVTSPDQRELLETIQKVNLLEDGPTHLGTKIELPAPQIAVFRWPKMIRQTQSDGKERGTVVSLFHSNLTTSRIFPGDEKSIIIPPFPHGIKSLWPFTKYVTHVHSHPMPGELNHIKTSLISNNDIRSFFNSSFKAMVMIDRGGTHLLLRDQLINLKEMPSNLSDQLLDEAKTSGDTVKEVMKKLADILYGQKIRYYYTDKLEPVDNHVQFTDARTF